MRKMKDMRGSHVSAVRTAIFRKFGLQLASSRRKNSRDIMDWKQFKEVKDSHNKLFTEDTAIEEITNSAFPSLSNADDETFKEVTDITSKNKSADDNEDEDEAAEDESLYNDANFNFKSYDSMFD